jgi:glycosyltransferase involved in cell wall biosynthesis
MLKVYISPSPEEARDGVRRVIEAMHQYLPASGVEIVDDPQSADVINIHGLSIQNTPPDKPLVYTSHGLFWGDVDGWPDIFHVYNQHMIDLMKRATVIVAVSDWVAHAIRRGIMKPVRVIKHGVDSTLWQPPKEPGAYILYNKGRPDPVSDPADVGRLAALLTGHPFVSTFGAETPNLRVTGYMEHTAMKEYVRHAAVYLSLARETFGIGTLEAMASGVPVVGWKYGGNREIVEHGVTGYLADPGNYEQLARYVRLAEANREALSKKAREVASLEWGWPVRIAQYADLFREVHRQHTAPRPDVSVIVTCYNLGRFLGECLDSVAGQVGVTTECLIVDDGSTDNTAEVAARYPQFKYLKTPTNLGLSEARNYGIAHSTGKYIFPLDADDKLSGPRSLAMLADALNADPSLHVAYGHLDIISEDGTGQRRNDWPFTFNWYGQLAHLNQLPYCSMMRREVWENTGGYRARNWRAEDAYFWCYATSYGYTPKKVTEDTVLLYRIRGDSKSALERQRGFDDGDWAGFFPYRLARTAQEGAEVLAAGKRPNPAVVPFGATGERPSGMSWPVWSHHDPTVSIVIPVGPGHAKYVIDAVDSIIAQDYVFYEVVVVNDTGQPLRWLPEWVKVVDTGGRGSIGHARNAGVEAATAPLILFLDADDMLMPPALSAMLKAYHEVGGEKYVYCDWLDVSPGSVEAKSSKPYEQNSLRGMHPISCLMERGRILQIGGFDEDIKGWEDWDFFIRCAISGYCGYHLGEKLLVYRTFSGKRREDSLREADNGLLKLFEERYQPYISGEKMMDNCCGGDENAGLLLKIKRDLGMYPEEPVVVTSPSGKIRLEFLGQKTAPQTFRNEKLSRAYQGGNNPVNKYTDADNAADAAFLEQTGLWRRVRRPNQVDLTVAQVHTPDVPTIQPVAGNFQNVSLAPEPSEPEPAVFDLDPASHTLKELESLLVGQDELTLIGIQQAEMGGKNRKGVLTLIDELLSLSRRVSI